MSNGIYPNYVGPTVEYRYNSLYPSWVRAVAGIVLPPLEWLGGVLVLSQPYGIGMVVSRISAIAQSAISAVTTVFSNRDTITTGEPGVEVEDEEPRI